MYIIVFNQELNYSILDVDKSKVIEGFGFEISHFPKHPKLERVVHRSGNQYFASHYLENIYVAFGTYAQKRMWILHEQFREAEEISELALSKARQWRISYRQRTRR